MKKTIIDINPFGIVEDLHCEKNFNSDLFREEYRKRPTTPQILSESGDFIELMMNGMIFNLKVARAMGGNQFNVWQNLKTLHPEKVQNGTFDAHSGFGEKIHRKVMYVTGIDEKIDLSNPVDIGDPVFDRDLSNSRLFISSSPHGEMGQAWWQSLRDALEQYPDMEIVWNPGSKQINRGGISQDTLKALKDRVRLMQVNEKEAKTLVSQHLHPDGEIDRLKDLVNATWTLVTRGPKGIRAYENGNVHDEEIIEDTTIARRFLREEFCESNDVGCGDSVMATFLGNMDNLKIHEILKIANTMAKIQYHHKGPNLSTVKGFQIEEDSCVSARTGY